MVEDAREEGLEITAHIYTYPAGATRLNITILRIIAERSVNRY